MKAAVLIGFGLTGLLMGNVNPQLQNYVDSLAKEAQASERSFDGFNAARGEKIFTAMQKDETGKPISCTSCHTTDLTKGGENAKTGKRIDPLAPSANPKALTDVKNVQKWLRRNFKDVYGREGTAREKGDVIAYIMSK